MNSECENSDESKDMVAKLLSDCEAMYALGMHYAARPWNSKDRDEFEKRTIFWFRKAYAADSVRAHCALAMRLLFEESSRKESLELICKLADDERISECDASELHQLVMYACSHLEREDFASKKDIFLKIDDISARMGCANACSACAWEYYHRREYKKAGEMAYQAVLKEEFTSSSYDLLIKCFMECQPGEMDALKCMCGDIDMEKVNFDRTNPNSLTNTVKKWRERRANRK